MVGLTSYAGGLRRELESIETSLMELLDASTIKRVPHDDDGGFVFITPPHAWGPMEDADRRLQMDIKQQYTTVFEHVNLLFDNAPKDMQRQLEEADKLVSAVIERKHDWYIPSTITQMKAKVAENFRVYYDLIALKEGGAAGEVMVVPDTNAIIAVPDVPRYAEVVGRSDYTVLLVPTVLQELDQLKVVHRDRDFRDKVESVIRRIKGWRGQGRLSDGVIVNRTVTVKTVGPEPNFQKTLHWLDPSNNDDRIIASVLEMQRSNPSAIIALMTSDINAQNKAEVAHLPYVEPPDAQ